MPVADLNLPSRLLAGGGPSTPNARVLRVLTTPVIGQFDPAFTQIMDEVIVCSRAALLTSNARCFPVTGLAAGGLEAVLDTLLHAGDGIAIEGSAPFIDSVMRIAGGYGLALNDAPKLAIVPHLDPYTGVLTRLRERVAGWHERDVPVLVEATHGLGGVELRTDDWRLDAVVAGVDHCLGAPSGMTLVTYTDALAETMQAWTTPPRTSYLDLLQLQAYWSPERLNHHTAPTSLVYALREALRVLHEEGLEASWARHAAVSALLARGLAQIGDVHGDGPLLIVQPRVDVRDELLAEFGIHVQRAAGGAWRVGMLGADAHLDNARALVAALEHLQ
jgi:(S)-ureidoglycine-glyoxylate aminotransferase